MRAGHFAGLCLGLGIALAPGHGLADITPEDVIDPGARTGAVERAMAWQRLQSEIVYLRPTAPFEPSGDIRITVPEPPPSEQDARSGARLRNGVIVVVIILAVVIVFLKFGSRIQVSFGDTREGRRASTAERERARGAVVPLPENGLLEHLAAMPDRREALILLTGHALERAASLNGLTLGRAQTARDVVRVLPRQWSHGDAIRRLVREAEIVHFGGRQLAEETWQACLAMARPLFARRGKA